MDTPLLNTENGSVGESEEAKPVNAVKKFGVESRRLWKLAGPAICTALCQYSLGALTQTFAGLVGEIELAAVSIENSVIAGLAFGVMLGMGSALETLCGQAFGAGKLRMLGVYMQRSWVILITSACILVPIYVFSPPILELIGETTEISEAADARIRSCGDKFTALAAGKIILLQELETHPKPVAQLLPSVAHSGTLLPVGMDFHTVRCPRTCSASNRDFPRAWRTTKTLARRNPCTTERSIEAGQSLTFCAHDVQLFTPTPLHV